MQQASTVNQTNTNDEISLAELFQKINKWLKFILKKWWIILIACVIGGGLGFTYAFFKKKEYIGKLTFILEDTKSGGMGSYASLASQFGIDLGGAGGSGLFQGDNINEFLKSRLMVQRTLLTVATINNKTQTLADHYVDMYAWKEKWQEKKALSTIHFDTTQSKQNVQRTVLQDSVLNLVYKDLVKEHLTIGKPDKKLSFIEVKCTTLNEYFSKYFIERLVNEALQFYVDAKTRRSKANVEKLQRQADSVLGMMNYKTYVAAASQDINVNPTKRVATVQTEIATRDKTVLMTVYGEVLKNLGMAKMVLAQETPVIQIIDTPILPLDYNKTSKLISTIIGAFLAGFIIMMFLSFKYMIKQSIQGATIKN